MQKTERSRLSFHRLSVSGCEEISSCLIRFARIPGEVVPNPVKVDAFSALHQSLRVRSMEIEMPDTWVLKDLIPRIDAGNWSINNDQPFDFFGIMCGVSIADHVPNAVGDDEGAVGP